MSKSLPTGKLKTNIYSILSPFFGLYQLLRDKLNALLGSQASLGLPFGAERVEFGEYLDCCGSMRETQNGKDVSWTAQR